MLKFFGNYFLYGEKDNPREYYENIASTKRESSIIQHQSAELDLWV